MKFDNLFYRYFDIDFNTVKSNFLKSQSYNKPEIFSESYFEHTNSYLLEYVNGLFITDSITSSTGYSYRQIENMSVKFQATHLSPHKIRDIGFALTLGQFPALKKTTLTNFKRRKTLQKAEAEILAKSASIEGLAFKWQTQEKFITILNNREFCDHKIESLAGLSINLKIKKHGVYFEGKAALSGRDESDLFKPQKISRLIEKALTDAENKSNCVNVQPGVSDIVFANGYAGLIFHELVGHLLEADYIANDSSIFRNCVGQKIADVQLNLVDACHDKCAVNFSFDDEGGVAKETILVENGILKNYISDYYHAINFNIAASGNARRQSYKDLPLPRMTNTLTLNGKYSRQEIIDSVKKGLLVTDTGNGMVNPQTGNFTFTNANGFFIEKGKITTPFRDIEIRGNVKEALHNIEMIGNDFACAEVHADCIKENQIIEVGFGQPTVKISGLTIK